METFKFAEINAKVKAVPGVYRIYRSDGLPLKVGQGGNVRKRLNDHKGSRQSALKPNKYPDKPMGVGNIKSKGSVLAAHLYCDKTVAPEYDLTTQDGRRAFLATCYIEVDYYPSHDLAKEAERLQEDPSKYRYVGTIIAR